MMILSPTTSLLRNTAFLSLLWLSACNTPTAPSTPSGIPSPEEQYPGLFEAVEMGDIFADSKTFPDCSPKATPEEIMKAYSAEKDLPAFDLSTFVATWFSPPQQFASGFVSDTTLSVEAHIERLWPILTREPDSLGQGTLLPLPYPYIVPGGRFGEIYYWDSYFTMLGLRVSENHSYMIRHMVDNFSHLIQTVGFIPNGNRSYFLSRSQPPFFSLMVRLLSETDSTVRLSDYLDDLETEYLFWMEGDQTLTKAQPAQQRVVLMANGSFLNRYWDDRPSPRPESYREDILLAEKHPERDPAQLYRDLRAACESGWDFSTRWLKDPNELGSIRTTEIIPVDLNVLLWHAEHTLAEAAREKGFQKKAEDFQKWADERRQAIDLYLWDEKKQHYVDYLWAEQQATDVPSLAMSFPLFLGIASEKQASAVAQHLNQSFLQSGGLQTTLFNSGQQWDAPNGWAPLQYVSIEGLRRYGLESLAQTIADRWISLNRRVYKQSGKLTEKYQVVQSDKEAGGGEYPVQDGFGWTNGVLLHFLVANRIPAQAL